MASKGKKKPKELDIDAILGTDSTAEPTAGDAVSDSSDNSSMEGVSPDSAMRSASEQVMSGKADKAADTRDVSPGAEDGATLLDLQDFDDKIPVGAVVPRAGEESSASPVSQQAASSESAVDGKGPHEYRYDDGADHTAVMPTTAALAMDQKPQGRVVRGAKKESIWNKPIGSSKEKSYPTKTAMNLVQREAKAITPGRLLVYILLAVIALGLIGKFGIYDQYAAVARVQQQNATMQTQLDALNASLKNYDSVSQEYAQYSQGYLSDSELSTVSRGDALALVDQHIRNAATVGSVTIKDNTMTVNCTNITLAEAGQITDDLKTQPLVSDVNLYTASLNTGNTRGNASFVINLQAASSKSN